MVQQHCIEPEDYRSTQDGPPARVAWMAWMQLRKTVGAEGYKRNYSLEVAVREESGFKEVLNVH